MIGKRGQTLDSLQYLVSLVVNKKSENYVRVKLDTENYRERRKETLETLAKNIAYKVKRTKRSVSLEPMNPYERRIIHAALQNDKYVTTRSEGEDPFRHVIISLKREGRRERSDGYGRYEKFGHVVLCGLGGIFVEVLKDVSSGLAPLSYEEAYSMIHSLRAYKIIQGTRGQKGVNEDKFAEIIVRLSTLLRFATEIKEMDINPLLATEKAVVAVDARIRIEK